MAGSKTNTKKAAAAAGKRTKAKKSKPVKPNFNTFIYRVLKEVSFFAAMVYDAVGAECFASVRASDEAIKCTDHITIM